MQKTIASMLPEGCTNLICRDLLDLLVSLDPLVPLVVDMMFQVVMMSTELTRLLSELRTTKSMPPSSP